MLDSLDREYRREEDWCNVDIQAQLARHQEKKEAFLKACTLARRTAENFLKYMGRSLQYYNYQGEAGTRSAEQRVISKFFSSRRATYFPTS